MVMTAFYDDQGCVQKPKWAKEGPFYLYSTFHYNGQYITVTTCNTH